MLGIQERIVFSYRYLRNKSVWTLSRNLQISPICINRQILNGRFFLQNARGGLLLPVTGYAHHSHPAIYFFASRLSRLGVDYRND